METFLKSYLKQITNTEPSHIIALSSTAQKADQLFLNSFQSKSINVLLLGNVQSGKTGHMFSILAKAADRGFNISIILTSDNNTLYKQTLERARHDLANISVLSETESIKFAYKQCSFPCVIVLKKNYRNLNKWIDVFHTSQISLQGNYVLIIDDEADASSLNTKVNQNQQSEINRCLETIKNLALKSVYLQVTGTPQALLLQSLSSGWKPDLLFTFEPGASYLGGDFFFSRQQKCSCIELIDDLADPELDFVIHHLLVSSICFLQGISVSNALIHTSNRKADHQKYQKIIADYIVWAKDNFDSKVRSLINEQYLKLPLSIQNQFSLEQILVVILDWLKQQSINILVLNSDSVVGLDNYQSGINFIIGGNCLSRGVTFKALNSFFYTRTSKNPQADTLWQHNRIFGYDRNTDLLKIYMPVDLYELFIEINESNNNILEQVNQNKNLVVGLTTSKSFKPTRQNVIDLKKCKVITGGVNLYPLNIGDQDIATLDQLLVPFAKQTYVVVNLKFIKQVLSLTKAQEPFDLDSILRCVDTLNVSHQAILIVRTNRDLTKGTGAILSEDLWKLGKEFPNLLVLTILKVTGKGAWNNQQLWIPNVKFPSSSVFYLNQADIVCADFL